MSSLQPVKVKKSEKVLRSCKISKRPNNGDPIYIVKWNSTSGYQYINRFKASALSEQEIDAFEERLASKTRILMDIASEARPSFAYLAPNKPHPKRIKPHHDMPPQYLDNGFTNPNWLRAADRKRNQTWAEWAAHYW